MTLLEKRWYQPAWWLWCLWPLTLLFWLLSACRRLCYRIGLFKTQQIGVPVIVVGNITVGGNGKTPVVIRLCEWLKQHGYQPGVVSRGYGGKSAEYPLTVSAESDPKIVGDEPVLIRQRLGCPLVVDPKRARGARYLKEKLHCNVIVCDDGLQHYRLQRDLEILVVDADRRFGNGRCLPAGPLREPVARARRVDLVILNGDGGDAGPRMRLTPGPAVSLTKPAVRRALTDFRGSRVTAVAGIGHPERFFAMLRRLGLDIDARPYPDHHRFSAADLATWPAGPVLMTEKDAVKCRGLSGADAWYVPVDAQPDDGFVAALEDRLGLIRSLGPAASNLCK